MTRLPQIPGGKLLDIASGSGNFLQWLPHILTSPPIIFPCDLLLKPLTVIPRYLPEKWPAFPTVCNANQLPFQNDSFDITAISNSIHHLPDKTSVFTEMLRTLRPSGFVIVNEMVSDDLQPAQITHQMIHHWSADGDMAQGVFHRHTFTRGMLTDIVMGLDLKDLQSATIDFAESDPFDDALIQQIRTMIQSLMAQMRSQNLPELADCGNSILNHLHTHGFRTVTHLLFVGRKPGD